MEERLGLAKAARLAGVSRSELQEHVESGELETFEDKVRLEDLRALYPDVVVEDESMLHKMADIKEEARQHRGDDHEPTTPEELAQQLGQARQELSHYKTRIRELESLTGDLIGMLEDMAGQGESVSRSQLETVINWSRHRRAKGR